MNPIISIDSCRDKFGEAIYCKGGLVKIDNIFINPEDPILYSGLNFSQLFRTDFKFNHTYLLVIRDPFNFLASRVCWKSQHNNHTVPQIMNMWKNNAYEFIGDTNFMETKICISYNSWFSSQSYRKEIADQLAIVPDINCLNTIPGYGKGSSFDRYKFRDKASKMNVLQRWQQVEKNINTDKYTYEEYKKAFDEETIELSRRIFGSEFTDPIVASLARQSSSHAQR